MASSIQMRAKNPPRRAALSWTMQERLQQTVAIVVLSLIGLLFLFPYFFMIVSALRAPFYNFASIDQTVWPKPVSTAGFRAILTDPFYTGTDGTMSAAMALLRGVATPCSRSCSSWLGYHYQSSGGLCLCQVRLLGAHVPVLSAALGHDHPGEITLVPKYVMFTKWGFIGTHWR